VQFEKCGLIDIITPAFVGVAWKGVAGRFTNKQIEFGVNLLQNKEMIVKECGFKYIQPEGR
jgi:hypothetical protein